MQRAWVPGCTQRPCPRGRTEPSVARLCCQPTTKRPSCSPPSVRFPAAAAPLARPTSSTQLAPQGSGRASPSASAAGTDDLAQSLASLKIALTQQQLAAAAGSVSAGAGSPC